MPKLLVFAISGLITALAIATGAFVLPIVGPSLRRIVYGLSRCWAKGNIGQVQNQPKQVEERRPQSNWEQPASFMVTNFNHIINTSYVCLAFYLAGLAPYLINNKWQLNTAYILLAISAVYLLAIYLPKMEKPHIHVSYTGPPGTVFCDQHCTCIAVERGMVCPIIISIANVGLTYYKNCTFWLRFPEDFAILEEGHECYDNLDFKKKLELGNSDSLCMLSPRSNDLSFAPFTEIVLPICMRVPTESSEDGNRSIEISATSESTWGRTDTKLEVQIR